jgi:hypothetical protein
VSRPGKSKGSEWKGIEDKERILKEYEERVSKLLQQFRSA